MLSGVNDGYGDPQSRDQDLNQLLGDYKNWLTTMVRAIAHDQPSRHDDLVQEAYIAMWRGLTSWDGRGNLEGYVRQKARWRVQSLAHGGPRAYVGSETGHVSSGSQRRGDETRRRIKSYMREYVRVHGTAPSMAEAGRALGMAPSAVGKQMKKLGNSEMSETASQVVEAYRTTSLELLTELGIEPLSFAEKASDIELAYHYGEIHAAVAELPEVWREYIWLRFWGGLSDSEAARSVDHVARGSWLKKIKPELAERLAHLESAY